MPTAAFMSLARHVELWSKLPEHHKTTTTSRSKLHLHKLEASQLQRLPISNMQFRWPYPLSPGQGVWGPPTSNHK